MARRAKSTATDADARLAQALEREQRLIEQQAATSEILRVISASRTDVQAVFDTIVRSAVRLLGGFSGLITRIVGEQLHLAALTSTNPSGDVVQVARWPRAIADAWFHSEIIGTVAPHFVADAESDPSVPSGELTIARARGYRSIVGVPLLRDGRAMGTITVTRPGPGRFADADIASLQSFADQAVIAIENARLFTELDARNHDLRVALEQQTATADILRVISASPTDIQPVFATVAERAARLCEAHDASIFRRDGDRLELVARYGPIPFGPVGQAVVALVPGTVNGRCVLEARTIHVTDLQAERAEFPEGSALARQYGHRATLSVPLLRDGIAIGSISLRRAEPEPFPVRGIALLQTFADQAVIAIENVRLFGELQEKNKALTEALDQQTATADILKVISSSPTDVQPVFDTIMRSISSLCGAPFCVAYRYDGEQLHLVAHDNATPAVLALLEARYPQAPSLETATGVSVIERRIVHIPDAAGDDVPPGSREFARVQGWGSMVAVPLLRHGEAVGNIAVARVDRRPFSEGQIALVQTFADQAVIAIENVRLFREIEDKSRQLEAASRHKSEFLANMSHELRTPLNAIIGFSEVLSDRLFGELTAKQDEYLHDINDSGQHLLSLINDILDLSKIEAGRMELEPTDFDLPAAIDNALTLVRERAARRGIALHHSVDPQLGHIRADERKVKQIVLNLLSNAVKFTPEGGRIDVRAALAHGAVEIAVTDTGIGITREDQATVFEEFRQVGTADKKAEGTGLGLALCRKFVELHGGRIWVKSDLGHGATFAFTLPLNR